MAKSSESIIQKRRTFKQWFNDKTYRLPLVHYLAGFLLCIVVPIFIIQMPYIPKWSYFFLVLTGYLITRFKVSKIHKRHLAMSDEEYEPYRVKPCAASSIVCFDTNNNSPSYRGQSTCRSFDYSSYNLSDPRNPMYDDYNNNPSDPRSLLYFMNNDFR